MAAHSKPTLLNAGEVPPAPLAARRVSGELKPAAAVEVHRQADGKEAAHDDGEPEKRDRPVRDEVPVLAEEARDDGKDKEDGRDARQDLHDLVQPVGCGGQVRVDDVRGELAEGVNFVGHTEDVVVDVLEVRALSGLAKLADVAAHEDLKHVALGRDRLAELEQLPFDDEELAEGCVRAMQVRSGLLRDELLEQLDALAELVDDLEVLVDH